MVVVRCGVLMFMFRFPHLFSHSGGCGEFLVGLGFLCSVSYIKPIPTHIKIVRSCGKKVAQMPPSFHIRTSKYIFFSVVGLAVGSAFGLIGGSSASYRY